MIIDDVLVADIARHLLGNRPDFLKRSGQVGDATGLIGEGLQGVSRFISFVATVFIREPDGIYHRTAKVLHAANRLLQGEMGSIVGAIGNDEQHLVATLAMLA